MGKFIQLHAIKACNIPNSDEGYRTLETVVCLNIDHIVFVGQIGSNCVVLTDAPVCSESSEYNREGFKWMPQSNASEITVKEPYEDVVNMINN